MPDATHPDLGDVTIDQPCDESWDAMDGDDARRFCGTCNEYVHSTAGLTDEELAPIIADRSKCLRVTSVRGRLVTASRLVVLAAAISAAPAEAAPPPQYERPSAEVRARARKAAAKNPVPVEVKLVSKPDTSLIDSVLGDGPEVSMGVRRLNTTALIGRRGN